MKTTGTQIMVQTEFNPESIDENGSVSLELPSGGGAIITRVNGDLIAFSAKCPHAAGDFREGEIHRGRAYCPVHQWKFDLVTGRCMGDENYRIKKYPIQIVNGFIVLDI